VTRRPGDAGITLIEMAISMFVMALFMVAAMSGILALYRTTNLTQSGSEAQQDLTVAFGRLDREVRYASAISAPGLVGADSYVEFLTTWSGTPTCTQLRLNRATGELQQRTWDQGGSLPTPTGWARLASGVTADTPFTVDDVGSPKVYQQLALDMTIGAGGAANRATRGYRVAFTAQNSSSVDTRTTCAEGRALP
jgi:hypothetical protein